MANYKANTPVIATLTEASGSDPAWSSGVIIGKLINVSITPNMNTGELYGDDALAESVVEFGSVTVSLNTTTLPASARATLFGETYTAATTGQNPAPETLVSKGSSASAYLGFGFVVGEIIDGVEKYAMVWLHKVKFSMPADSYTTKGDSIEFGTPTIEGTGTTDSKDEWRTIKWYDSKSAAVTALKSQAGIS